MGKSVADRVREYFEEIGDEDALTADGFDEAVVGVSQQFNTELVAYDYDKVIEILMQDMSYEDAVEYYNFNIIGAWVGNRTPAFIRFFRSVKASGMNAEEEVQLPLSLQDAPGDGGEGDA